MVRLITRGRFTHDYAKGLVGAPEDRQPAVRKLIESAGAWLINFYFTTGDSDFVCITEADDAEAGIAAMLGAVAAGRSRIFPPQEPGPARSSRQLRKRLPWRPKLTGRLENTETGISPQPLTRPGFLFPLRDVERLHGFRDRLTLVAALTLARCAEILERASGGIGHTLLAYGGHVFRQQGDAGCAGDECHAKQNQHDKSGQTAFPSLPARHHLSPVSIAKREYQSSSVPGASFQFGRTSILLPRDPHLAHFTLDRNQRTGVSPG